MFYNLGFGTKSSVMFWFSEARTDSIPCQQYRHYSNDKAQNWREREKKTQKIGFSLLPVMNIVIICWN